MIVDSCTSQFSFFFQVLTSQRQTAGLGSACSHIVALLFKLEAAVHLKLKDSTAPASVLCSWKSCKKEVEPAPLKAVNFSMVKQRGLPGENTKNVPHEITHYTTKNPSAGKFPLKKELVQSLYKINPQAVFFKGIDLHDYDIELVIRLMIFNKQIKNGDIKLRGSNGPSWSITAIVFYRKRIRFRNPSIVFLSIYSMSCSFIKIQDTKFK